MAETPADEILAAALVQEAKSGKKEALLNQ